MLDQSANNDLYCFLKSLRNIKSAEIFESLSFGMRGHSFGKFYCHIVGHVEIKYDVYSNLDEKERNILSWDIRFVQNTTIIKCNNIDEFGCGLQTVITFFKLFGIDFKINPLPMDEYEIRKIREKELELHYKSVLEKEIEASVRKSSGIEVHSFHNCLRTNRLIEDSLKKQVKTATLKESKKALSDCKKIQIKIKDLIKGRETANP